MSNISHPKGIALLKDLLEVNILSYPFTRRLLEAMGNSGGGQQEIYAFLEAGKLPNAYKTTAVLKLMNSWNPEIKENAPKFLESTTSENLNVYVLVERSGDAIHGK